MQKFRFILVALCLYLSACNSANHRPNMQPATTNSDKQHVIYVIRHSWHTGIVLQRHMLGRELAFLKNIFANKTYYEFGWGHRGFYRARNGSVTLYLRSALLPSTTVMHIAASNDEPKVTYPPDKLIALKISEQGLHNLRKGLLDSFNRDNAGLPVRLEKGLYGDSYFFEGAGTYTTFGNTCNTWTARMLKMAGVQVRTFMSLTANSVMTQVRRVAK